MVKLPFRRAVQSAAAIGLVANGLHAAGQPVPGPMYTDVSAGAGVRFQHENGAAGAKWYPELFGGGVAVLDVDADTRPDLLFVNGRSWTDTTEPTRHLLLRNNGDGTFRDVTAGSGFDTTRVYGLGATVADYDNDGRDDVFLTTVNGGRLFHNAGGGRFTDVTVAAGITPGDFAVSAAWLDYDKDGRADLFIGHYVQWTPALEVRCAGGGVQGYCGPDAYRPTPPTLYRNTGNGRFANVTASAGLSGATNKAMGVAVVDYNSDGWPDIFVANDRVPARLLRNTGKGGFIDEAIAAGVALSEHGAARANMGVDAADYDASGHPDIVVGNFVYEMLGLYRGVDGRMFTDVAPRSEIGRASLLFVTWATFFLDVDLDGRLDIFALNGGTDESQGMDARARLSQPPLVLRQRADHTFEQGTPGLGAAFNRPIMGRGAAAADFDGDGDLDLALTTLAGPAYLYRCDQRTPRSWLRVRLSGTRSTRSALGARVTVTTTSGAQTQVVRSGSSYASQSELALTFGLDAAGSARVDVAWPSGATQTFRDVRARQVIAIDESAGIVPTRRP